jgi:hypothetical protein
MKKSNKLEDFPIFSQADPNTVKYLVRKLNRYLFNFSSQTGINGITIYQQSLYEMIERIEKRRVYFYIFYEGCRLGELNEGALMCFWILKLTPFYHSNIPTYTLNANIALCVFRNMLEYIAKLIGKKVNMTEQIINDLFYSFCYRDLSKESIMLLAESLLY